MNTSTGKLVLCPTPIGNLGDITLRTLDELRAADVVCAEDTRVTGKLLAHFDIEKRLERLDEATISKQADRIIQRVLAGERIAFCSDAGMPGVSDPGSRLVASAQAAGAPYEVLPGASAAATAYVASGFSDPRYYFGGFFPRKTGERKAVLEALSGLDASLVFYESPRRIADALAVVAEVFPAREVAVCRELTKRHEEVFRAMAPIAAEEFARRDAEEGVKSRWLFALRRLPKSRTTPPLRLLLPPNARLSFLPLAKCRIKISLLPCAANLAFRATRRMRSYTNVRELGEGLL